jgi:hypothetical protein
MTRVHRQGKKERAGPGNEDCIILHVKPGIGPEVTKNNYLCPVIDRDPGDGP